MKKTLVFLFALLVPAGGRPASPALASTPTLVTPTSTPTAPLRPRATPTHLPAAMATRLPPTGALSDSVRVTYVGNSGFLIAVGDKKILIDALFHGFPGDYALPQDVQELLVNARPPFDGVDLILATHDHGDHFSADMVRQHMRSNPAAVLVSTSQVAGQLADLGNRVISLHATEGRHDRTDVGGIQVEAIYLSHGAVPAGETEIVNFGYVVTVDGISLFHTGDIDASLLTVAGLQAHGLPERRLALAFIPHFILAVAQARPLVAEGIRSRYIFPSHYHYTPQVDPTRIERNYPGAVLFEREMQSWVMP